MMSVTYFILFLGNLSMWNYNTYTDVSNKNVIQIIVAILTLYILLPILACFIAGCTKTNKTSYETRYDNKPKKKYIHTVGHSMKRLPVIKTRVSDGTKVTNKNKNKNINDTETVAMTQKQNQENVTRDDD